MSHLFQLGEICVSPFSIPGSNTGSASMILVCGYNTYTCGYNTDIHVYDYNTDVYNAEMCGNNSYKWL